MKNNSNNKASRVLPSVAIKKAYYKKLMKIIDDMDKSVKYFLEARYKREEDKIVANDSASSEVEQELKKLYRRWSKRFDDLAKNIADWFVKSSAKHTNTNLKEVLKKAGWTVELKLTRYQQNKLRALTIENINLIKSIPEKYFVELTNVTMQSIQRGRDLNYLRDEIVKRYGVCKRRAALIARDQNNKASSIIVHSKYEELGITRAIWKHNPGSKVPRLSHIAVNNKEYEVSKGMYIDGVHIYPGEAINCGCTSMPVLPELIEGKKNAR